MLEKITIHDLCADSSNYDYADTNVVVSHNLELFSECERPLSNKIYLIVCCMQGNGILTLNRRLYTFQPGDICICCPSTKLNLTLLSDYQECYIIGIKPSYIHRLVRNNSEHLSCFPTDLNSNPVCRIEDCKEYQSQVFLYTKLIFDIVYRKSDYFKKELLHNSIRSFLLEIFLYLKEIEDYNKDREYRNYSHDIVFELFQKELKKNNGRLVSAREYADIIGCSTKFLSLCLIQKTGYDTYQLIEKETIEQAKILLIHSSLPIREICAKLNFPNQTLFSKFIKRHLGIKPLDLRKERTKSGSHISEDYHSSRVVTSHDLSLKRKERGNERNSYFHRPAHNTSDSSIQ